MVIYRGFRIRKVDVAGLGFGIGQNRVNVSASANKSPSYNISSRYKTIISPFSILISISILLIIFYIMSAQLVPDSIGDTHRNALESIGNLFHLSPERLVDISKRFVEDFMVGLSEYSHPMAMM